MNPDPEIPPAVARSPLDHTSDREQSDTDQEGNLARSTADREQADADQAITVGKLDTLIASNRELTTGSEDVAAAVAGFEEAVAKLSAEVRTNRRRWAIVVASLAVLLVVVIAVSTYTGARGRAQITDCVQPTGKCFQQSNARLADLIGNLNKVTALAAACAPDYVTLPIDQRETAIMACITRGLSSK